MLLPHDRSYLGIKLLKAPVENGRLATGDSRLILDIGANNGISSLGFIKLLPEWDVYAVEANSLHTDNLQKLKRRFRDRFDFMIAVAGSVSRTRNQTIRLHTPVWKGRALHTVTSTRAGVAIDTAVQVWRLKPSDINT
ncbi:MAG: hypothetical protein ACRERS_10475, partial [Methylococcales bacterium]